MASSMTGGRTGSAASGLAAMAPRRSFLANWPIRRRCTDYWSRSATSDCAWSRYAGWTLAEPETRPGNDSRSAVPVREPREGERLLGDGPSAAEHRWDAHRHDAEVGLEHHIWVENRHKRREVAITRGSEER